MTPEICPQWKSVLVTIPQSSMGVMVTIQTILRTLSLVEQEQRMMARCTLLFLGDFARRKLHHCLYLIQRLRLLRRPHHQHLWIVATRHTNFFLTPFIFPGRIGVTMHLVKTAQISS